MIYLDHAATSHPKPPEVLAAVQHWFTAIGVSPDRGDGPHTRAARDLLARARAGTAALCGLPADRVAFVSGATEGLNLALRALLRPGARVLTTAFEHSSVARPLVALAAERGLHLQVLPPAGDDGLDPEQVEAALAATAPDLLAMTHASNVTGACFDAAAICSAAAARGCLTLLDASQTAGLVDLRVGADVVVASAHKALHAPPGIGFVAARPGLDLPPQKHGGTGSSIALDQHPSAWPVAFEAGTPNMPAIAGLAAALDWLAAATPAALRARALAAREQLALGLRALPGVRVLGPTGAGVVPALSFVHRDWDPAEISSVLAGAGIHVRSGHHCAPWLHRHLGTAAAGTVRLSPGPATTAADVDAVLAVLQTL